MDALFGAILAGGLFCLLGWGFVKLTRGVESLINKKRNETNNEKPPENKISKDNHEEYVNEIKETKEV